MFKELLFHNLYQGSSPSLGVPLQVIHHSNAGMTERTLGINLPDRIFFISDSKIFLHELN